MANPEEIAKVLLFVVIFWWAFDRGIHTVLDEHLPKILIDVASVMVLYSSILITLTKMMKPW